MKVTIINRSDTTGGAAIVMMRLMEALRAEGVDARMLVAEKLSDSPFVAQITDRARLKASFLAERLDIFLHNGLSRDTLFKIDTGKFGLSLSSHPLVKDADIVCLGWFNQGFLSIDEIKKIKGKLVWTMHDMWPCTGICHHAFDCTKFKSECMSCPLLPEFIRGKHDISNSTFRSKLSLYSSKKINFVAVSNWLAGRCRESALLHDADVEVIPNPFPLPHSPLVHKDKEEGTINLLFGAARLDDPVKGFPTLVETTRILKNDYPELSGKIKLTTYGNIKNPVLLDEIAIPHVHLGRVSPDRLQDIYLNADIVVSTSHFETLPGTLVEGQAYGALPIAFLHGGQADIIDPDITGILVDYSPDINIAAKSMARAIVRGADLIASDTQLRQRMFDAVSNKFSARAVARKYIRLFESLLKQ